MKSVVVLGAGLAGLSASWKLAEEGFNVVVIERDSQVGGLAKTLRRDGYSCDLGPHRFISHNMHLIHEVESLLGKELLQVKQRKSKIWIYGRYIEYPPNLKDVLRKFNPFVSLKILIDYIITLIRNKIFPRPDDSFESWVINRFGKTLYNIYFKDYTAKLWHIPPTEISADWASQRISVVNLGEVLKQLILKKRLVPRTYANKFYYPVHGIGTVAVEIAKKIGNKGGKIYLRASLKKIKIESGTINSVLFSNAEAKDIKLKPDYVVSTIPIGTLARMISDDDAIVNAATHLKTRSLIYLFLLINKPRISNNHWIYFPEKKYTFNRISEIKNFSTEMVPPHKTALCIEITCDDGDEFWNSSAESLFNKTQHELYDIGIIKPKDIEDIFMHRESCAYPIYDIDYNHNLKLIFDFVSTFKNLISIGRQGLFRYNNMDHSIEMGFRTANYLLGRSAKKKIFEIGKTTKYLG